MGGLNDSHHRALRAAFRRIDELLTQIENVVNGEPSPLAGITNDLTPTNRRVATERVARVRRRMVDALDQLGIPAPAPESASSWVIETAATFAELALEEVTSSRLRKYGRLDGEAAQALERVEDGVRGALRELRPPQRKSGGRDGR